MKITEYSVISRGIPIYGNIVNATIDLGRAVNAKIKEGWQPLGGVAVTKDYAFQAIVKYEDNRANE